MVLVIPSWSEKNSEKNFSIAFPENIKRARFWSNQIFDKRIELEDQILHH